MRCHRSLIGDALLVRGIHVEDIIGPKGRKPHVLTAFAHVEGTQVTYPPPSLVEPQNEMQVDKCDHIAMHKGTALKEQPERQCKENGISHA